MPTEEENVNYLYVVLTSEGGTPAVDWDKVAADLSLSMGATKKRWSRLKQAMEKNASPGPSAQQFLWLAMKHSTREKAPDWNLIAQKCNIPTAGAASKRYSRMKQAFESGAAPPPVATKAKAGEGAEGKVATPAKRKRTTAKAAEGNEGGDEAVDGEDDKTEEKPKAKRAKATKKTAAVKKEEENGDEDMVDADAAEGVQEEEKPKPKRAPRGKKAAAVKKEDSEENDKADDEVQEEEKPKPKHAPRGKKAAAVKKEDGEAADDGAGEAEAADEKPKPKPKGTRAPRKTPAKKTPATKTDANDAAEQELQIIVPGTLLHALEAAVEQAQASIRDGDTEKEVQEQIEQESKQQAVEEAESREKVNGWLNNNWEPSDTWLQMV